MIEILLKYDNMQIIGVINALNCINNHIITCINSMLSDIRYTSLDPTNNYFMPFSLFFTFSIWTLPSFHLSLTFLFKLSKLFLFLYDIYDYLVMGHVFYDIFSIINVWLVQMTFYHGHH